VYLECLIRQDFVSLYVHRLIYVFILEEQKIYDLLTKVLLRKLIIKVGEDKFAWNCKHSCILTLLLTWLG
jgi:hypothetical protein